MSRLARSSDHHPSVADHIDRYAGGGESLTRYDSERLLALEELRDVGIIDDERYEAETAVLVGARPTRGDMARDPDGNPAGRAATWMRPWYQRREQGVSVEIVARGD